MIIHKKMSLFDAPKGSMLVHACNAQGVWGRGIAVEFKKRFPLALVGYNTCCKSYDHPVGHGWYFNDNGYSIGCIITSENYGSRTDPEYKILKNTENALEDLLIKAAGDGFHTIYSNKFNSGLFSVPWEKSEALLEKALGNYPDVTWIVCEL